MAQVLPPPVTYTARPGVVRQSPKIKAKSVKTKLHWAAIATNHDELKSLLNKDSYPPPVLNAKDELGRTALHWAVALNYENSVKLLLNQRGIDPNCQDKDGMTPLHEAVIKNLAKIVDLLLPGRNSQGNNVGKQSLDEKKGETATLYKSDWRGRTPLHWAAEYGHLPIVKCLINGDALAHALVKDLDQKDTALHRAALRNNATVVTYLIDKKPGLGYAKNKVGHTPLDIIERAEDTTKDWKLIMGILIKRMNDINADNDEQVHHKLAKICIKLMSASLKQDICDQNAPGVLVTAVEENKIKQYLPLELQNACLYWIPHLQKGNVTFQDKDEFHEFLHAFLQEHFLHWLEALSWMGELPEAIRLISSLEVITLASTSPNLHTFVRDVKRFALYRQQAIKQAPLEAYNSVLFISQTMSMVRRQLEKWLSQRIQKLPNGEKDWSAALQMLEGHSDYVNSVAFSPDGKVLVSGSGDKTVWLWDANTGAVLQMVEGHSERVTSTPSGMTQ